MNSFCNEYTYFIGSSVGIFISILLLLIKRDRNLLLSGIYVAILGVILEYFYFNDYWIPPLIFQLGNLGGLEDLMFGFSAGVIGPLLPNLILKGNKPRFSDINGYLKHFLIVLSVQILFILVGLKFGINSIYSSGIGFLLFTVYFVFKSNKDFYRALLGGVLGSSLLVVGEAIFLRTIAPDYLSKYFLLYDQVSIFNEILISTEIFWGLCFGSYIAVLVYQTKSSGVKKV